MSEKSKDKKSNETNLEFERTKDAFKQILSVPKDKLNQIEKRRSKPPLKSEKDCN